MARRLLGTPQEKQGNSMISSRQGSFAARGLAVLQSLGGWVAIHPEQTYVATSIRGLGACRSTFCPAERRELKAARRGGGARIVPLIAALAAAAGVLTACASDRPFGRDVTDSGRFERAPQDCQHDCQNRAAPVRGDAAASAAASAESAAVSTAAVDVRDAHEAAGSGSESNATEARLAAAKTALGKADRVALH
jgi:predicted small secreted protein